MALWRILVLALALLLGAASVSVLWDALNRLLAGGVPTGHLPQTALAFVGLAVAIAVIARVVDARDRGAEPDAGAGRPARLGPEPRTPAPMPTAGPLRRER
jgi:hypothetical protein